jgi:hypothetical protein
MADPRTARDLETRETEDRVRMQREYTPPSLLPTPAPQDGYGFRWVATAVMGDSTPTNASSKFREGWVPVKAADHPELCLQANARGEVEIGGLLLCKMPEEMIQARTAYYERQNAEQLKSVDQRYLREQIDNRMPLFSDKESETVRGKTRFGDGKK